MVVIRKFGEDRSKTLPMGLFFFKISIIFFFLFFSPLPFFFSSFLPFPSFFFFYSSPPPTIFSSFPPQHFCPISILMFKFTFFKSLDCVLSSIFFLASIILLYVISINELYYVGLIIEIDVNVCVYSYV